MYIAIAPEKDPRSAPKKHLSGNDLFVAPGKKIKLKLGKVSERFLACIKEFKSSHKCQRAVCAAL